MAQYRALIKGQKGGASRLGSKSSGIMSRTDGWDLGVTVAINFEDGRDVAEVVLTSGSNGRTRSVMLGRFTEADLKVMADGVREGKRPTMVMEDLAAKPEPEPEVKTALAPVCDCTDCWICKGARTVCVKCENCARCGKHTEDCPRCAGTGHGDGGWSLKGKGRRTGGRARCAPGTVGFVSEADISRAYDAAIAEDADHATGKG